MRCSNGRARGRCSRSSRGRTSSSCRWTPPASCTAITTCSPTCCGSSSAAASPSSNESSTRGRACCSRRGSSRISPSSTLATPAMSPVRSRWCGSTHPRMLGAGRSATVERWLAPFSPSELKEHPALAVIAAWCCVSAASAADRRMDRTRRIRRIPTSCCPTARPWPLRCRCSRRSPASTACSDMAASAARAIQLDRPDSFFVPTAAYLEGSALLLLGRRDRRDGPAR